MTNRNNGKNLSHHRPGAGVTPDLYAQALEPLGFDVKLYPHNHDLGSEVLSGNVGQAQFRYRFAQILSGIEPNSEEAALSLMCVADRKF